MCNRANHLDKLDPSAKPMHKTDVAGLRRGLRSGGRCPGKRVLAAPASHMFTKCASIHWNLAEDRLGIHEVILCESWSWLLGAFRSSVAAR